MENELDMEDIESRLYSQVHHSSVADEQLSNVFIPTQGPPQLITSNPYTLSNIGKRTTHRYFHKEHINRPSQPTYISFDDINSLQNNISISPTSTDITTEGNFSNQFQNNITVNQYTVPVIINSELNEVLNTPFSGKYFTSWAVQNQHLIAKKKKRSKKERNKEKKRQSKKANRLAELIIDMNLNGDMQRQANEVICVSDDSDDECVIQGVSLATPLDHKKVSTGFPKKYNDNDESSKKPESDDDIIYIPPPPIEVVNVDADDKEQEIEESAHDTSDTSNCEKKSSSSNPKATQKESNSPESSTSNDFLDSAAIGNNTHKFDFGLHGSDFNNAQAEFVRPTNPVDFCETESSCSTNELNRDFHNSVKTVVFNEVEFPREDIFSENNLEKFGTYITPKRNRNKKLEDNAVAISENIKAKDVVEVNSSTDSSSESDYEHSKSVNRKLKTSGLEASKKLPTLSPMVSHDFTTPKKAISKKKIASELRKDQSSPTVSVSTKKELSKKKLVVNTSESDSDTGKETPKSESKKLSKKKKMSTSKSLDIIVDSDSRRKRKKKRALQNFEENDDAGTDRSRNIRKKGISETNNSESGENTDECTSQKKKRRKSLRSGLSEIENNISADVLKLSKEIIKPENSEQPQDKKKKDSSESDNPQNEETTDLGISSSHKKKRKNSQELKTPQNDNIEASTSVQAEETIRHKSPEHFSGRKKKVSTGSNSGQEENIDAIRKKRKNRLDSNSPEKDNASSHSEAIVKKKKDRYLESITQPEYTSQETLKEKPKKKKKKIEKEYLETESSKSAGDEQQRVKKISFSELLNQPVDIDDKIEVEVQKKKKKKSLSPPDATVVENTHPEKTDSLMAKSDDLRESEVGVSPPQENEKETEVDKQPPFDESCKLNEVPVNPTNQVEPSVSEGAEDNDSDEQLIIVDDIDTNSPNLIVVEEIESTMINAEVVLSSDSEYDFRELTDVGKDLELANCVVQGVANDDSEEMIVVDDDSGGNVADRYSVDEQYSKFDVETIHNTQTDDPEAWKVSYKDRSMVLNRRPGPRCNRCRQFGHPAVRCSEKVRPPHCSLCGNPGHQEPRCPNKICRQCGNEGDYSTSYCWKCFKFRDSICKLCNMVGHIAKTCPDLWRRYHLTTDEGPIRVSREPQLKPRKDQWCSGCAKRGHLEHECRNYFSEFPPATPYIIKYEDVLYCDKPHETVDSPSATMTSSEGHNVPSCSSASENIPSTSTDIGNIQSHIPSQSSSIPSIMSLNIPGPSTLVSSGNTVVPTRSSCLIEVPMSTLVSSEGTVDPTSPSCLTEVPMSMGVSSGGTVVPTSPTCLIEEPVSTLVSNEGIVVPNSPSCLTEAPTSMLGSSEDTVVATSPSSLIEVPMSTLDSSEITVVSTRPSCIIEVPITSEPSTKVINPFFVLANQRAMNYQLDKRLRRIEERKYKHIIMSRSYNVVRHFLLKELAQLDTKITKVDPGLLQKQFLKFSRLMQRGMLTERSAKNQYFWCRRANMFLFGLHKLKDGYVHVNYLRKFVSDSEQELDENKRKSLFSAYSYIFGVDCHIGINYLSSIRKIIRRYDARNV